MNARENLSSLSRDALLELVDVYSKSWLALDGLWFQSVEEKLGMEAAMEHDEAAWRRYTQIEARRIRDFLKLGSRSGLQGLKRALEMRMYANLNRQSFEIERERHDVQRPRMPGAGGACAQGHAPASLQAGGAGGIRGLCPGH